jgi:cytochrome c-type biogenesis protein CcmH
MVMALALIAFGAIAFACKVPRQSWTTVAAALVLGLAGYAMQASPDFAGAPKATVQKAMTNSAAMIESRNMLAERGIPSRNQWLIIADGLARNSQFADAAQILRGAVEEDPKNAEAWLALANALVGHADGLLTPASQYAFRKAAEAAPNSPGPQYFLGMAMAQSGRLAEARRLWGDLLTRSAPDAPWRTELEANLAQLDSLIAAQGRSRTGQ